MLRWVKKQVETRQKVYGKTENRTIEEINYLNNKKPWIKLASSVKVKDKGVQKLRTAGLGEYGTGRKLAKNFILFNGSSNINEGLSNGFRSGIGDNNNAYGVGGTDFGYKPMPGIESISVTTKGSYGSLKEASVKILAYNKQQFDIIELLYLRLGYSVLLEFGNNIYLDNGGNVKQIGETITDTNWFNNSFTSTNVQENILKVQEEILKYKKKYVGNYEGILGKISNYNWEITKDGVYKIDLTIVTYGELINGFFINNKKVFPNDGEIGKSLAAGLIGKAVSFFSGLFGGEEEPDPPEIPDIDRKFLKNAKDVTDINGLLYMFYDSLYNAGGGGHSSRSNIGDPWKYYTKNINKDDFLLSKSKPADIFDIKTVGSADDSKGEGFTDDKYISLGFYLEVLNRFTLGFIGKGTKDLTGISPNADSTNGPVLFDNSQDTFFCNTNFYQISGDPTVCLIKNDGAPANVISESKYRTFKKTKNGVLVGDIMNIYLQMNYLAELCYNAAKNDQGKIGVKQHLEEILNKVSESLGGLNKLKLRCDENTGKLYIFDENPMPGRNKIVDLINKGSNEPKPVEFLVYGFTNEKGSFVRDFGIKSTIDNNLAATITIGKNSTGITNGYDATAFSNWNQGLEDIVMPTLIVSSQKATNLADLQSSLEKKITSLSTLANKLYKNDEKVKLKYTEQTKNVLREVVQLEQALIAATANNKNSSPSAGFIPISLELTMDGLAGMKIFQTYTIPTNFLPAQYEKAFDFIIKKYTHEVNNSVWTTKLESISIPADLSKIPTEPLFKMSASKLAEIVSETENEIADAEFESQQTLYDSRAKTQGGVGGIIAGQVIAAPSVSGGAKSFAPAVASAASVVSAPKGNTMPLIDEQWQMTIATWLPYDKVWIEQNNERVTYNSKPQTNRGGRAHGGIDVGVPGSLTAQLISPIGGKFVLGSQPNKPDGTPVGFGPQYPQIHATWNGRSIIVFMGHTNAIAPGLVDGAIVKAGDYVATQGTEGKSDGPHLHLDVRYQEGGTWYYLDVNRWLNSLPIPDNAYRT